MLQRNIFHAQEPAMNASRRKRGPAPNTVLVLQGRALEPGEIVTFDLAGDRLSHPLTASHGEPA